MIESDWKEILNEELNKDYFIDLINLLNKKYEDTIVYPLKDDIFNALNLTPYKDTKVVIIGQDPYHGENQAHGLAFSVKNEKTPPSLKNIFKELESDLSIKKENNNLEGWAKQGVLLLNTVLTVEKGKPLSHKNIGWERFTNKIIEIINNKEEKVIFVLLGEKAKVYKKLINENNIIIETSHPSPFSVRRGFSGSKIFSRINNELILLGHKEIDFTK